MKIQLRSAKAFTMVELSCVIGIVVIIALIVLPVMSRQRCGCASQRISCVNNLKQIGTAYRIWSGDNSDRYPQESSMHLGGWSEYLTYTNAGRYCWTNYALMQNELGQSPRVLLCPSDERKPANDFRKIGNLNMSYFIGAGARDSFPQSILAGDRNLAPGTKPKNDYGYSPKDGKGNDAIISTNSSVSPVCWSSTMHSAGNNVGAGNVLLGDGSVQQCSTARFASDYQANAIDVGTFPAGYVSATNTFRLIFP